MGVHDKIHHDDSVHDMRRHRARRGSRGGWWGQGESGGEHGGADGVKGVKTADLNGGCRALSGADCPPLRVRTQTRGQISTGIPLHSDRRYVGERVAGEGGVGELWVPVFSRVLAIKFAQQLA